MEDSATQRAEPVSEHLSALRAADHVQQTRLAALAHPHAHRVVTAVQRAHRAFNATTSCAAANA